MPVPQEDPCITSPLSLFIVYIGNFSIALIGDFGHFNGIRFPSMFYNIMTNGSCTVYTNKLYTGALIN